MPPPEPMAETLSHTATVGPFFSVRTNAGAPREQGFLPLPELYRQDSSPALHKRVEVVAARLGTTEQRVAASLVHQGLAGRLWSIALAPAALAGRVPDLGDDTLWWHPARSVPDEFWLPAPTTRPSPPEEDLTSRLRAAVVQGHLVPLQRAISTVCPISPRLLRGNAASALVGALRVLDGWCRRTGRKEAAERAVALTAAVLDDPLLRGSGTLDPAVPQFSRRSCCLYYRVPGGGLCGDCVLRRAGR
ncbi:(2Fe-2S)-binding protein [Streptomyces sp. BHT-5-2]|uniref:(2Fe-2S)-binding protein n=1 Tax=Streptomyces sp. BHT-5-2 TaxID=2866715 RepID=UPI0028C425AD|nr:(2Fe-2S)-binding protein [Streptomyces sp. BHT-5-2]